MRQLVLPTAARECAGSGRVLEQQKRLQGLAAVGATVCEQLAGLIEEAADDVRQVAAVEPAALQASDDVQHPAHRVDAVKVAVVAVDQLFDQGIGVDLPLLAGIARLVILLGHGEGFLLEVWVGSFPLARTWRKAENPLQRVGNVADEIG